MKSVKELDGELEKKRKLLAKFETERASLGKRLETLRGKRESLSLAAHSGDLEARKKLQAAHQDQRQAEIDSEDLQSAISGAHRELEALRVEKAETVRREQLEKYNAETSGLMTDAGELEKMLVGVLQAKSKLESRLESLNRAAFGLFPADQVPHRNIARGLRWALEQKLGIENTYRPREHKEKFSVPIQEMFERILRGAQTIEEQDNKPNSKQAASVANEPTIKKAKASSSE